MMGGEILQIASPENIYLDPVDLRVASFIGSPKINAFHAEADDRGNVTVDGLRTGIIAPSRGPVTFAVRPEDITPTMDGIPARLTHVEFLGDCALLHAETLANKSPVICRIAPDQRPRVAIGETINLRPDPAKSFLFDGNGQRVRATLAKLAAAHV
jgi:multiple sugar transport system ATP-binding protein